ncbi:hypothetical protein Patl1_34299 [Pistacia atlantica]|uniref:Uncharacterized protein n=1 Tax=Pistacia atlantica TaxID=434234 RepID=A0ACC0ZPJ5_9ROSI|nr:hypothetical protein Patl1_34299 [Pistacia atlantica]
MKFGWKIVVGTIIGFLGAACGVVGGVGGCGIFVAMLNLIIGFDTKSAAAISKCMITGATAITNFYNIKRSIGVVLNVIFAEWMITVLLITVFTVISIKSFLKGVETWKKETTSKMGAATLLESDGIGSQAEEFRYEPVSLINTTPNETKEPKRSKISRLLQFATIFVVKKFSGYDQYFTRLGAYEAFRLYKGRRRIASKVAVGEYISWFYIVLLESPTAHSQLCHDICFINDSVGSPNCHSMISKKKIGSRRDLLRRMLELEGIRNPSIGVFRSAGLLGSEDGGDASMSVAETGMEETPLEGNPVERLDRNGKNTNAKVLEVIRSQTRIDVETINSEKGGAYSGILTGQKWRRKDSHSNSVIEDEDGRDRSSSPMEESNRATGVVMAKPAAGQEQGWPATELVRAKNLEMREGAGLMDTGRGDRAGVGAGATRIRELCCGLDKDMGNGPYMSGKFLGQVDADEQACGSGTKKAVGTQGQLQQIMGILATRSSNGQRRSWANMAANSCQKEKLKMKFFKPIVASDGTTTICPPFSLALEGRRKWENCLVGTFIKKKLPFHSVQCFGLKLWQKYGIKEVMLNDKGFFFFKFGDEIMGARVDYQWRPSQCERCCEFGHGDTSCPRLPRIEDKGTRTGKTKITVVENDGFQLGNRKGKGKMPGGPKVGTNPNTQPVGVAIPKKENSDHLRGGLRWWHIPKRVVWINIKGGNKLLV